MPVILPARNIRNNIGMNGVDQNATGAAVLNYMNVRWVRDDITGVGSSGSGAAALASAMVSAGVFDPNPKYEVIIDGYYADASSNPWSSQQIQLRTLAGLTTSSGAKLFQAIEGPNEFGNRSEGGNGGSTGGGFAPGGTTQIVGSDLVDGCGTTSVMQAFGQWAYALYSETTSNASTYTGIARLSPSILDGVLSVTSAPNGLPGGYDGAAYPSGAGIAVAFYIDNGNFHWYSSAPGGSSTPCGQNTDGNNSGYLHNNYNGFLYGLSGGTNNLSLVLSEAGQAAQGWAQDGVSCAWCNMAYVLDHFRLGGERIFFYTAMNDFNGDTGGTSGHNGFSWFYNNNASSPTPSATCIRNMQTLFSLGNNYSNSANLTDTGSVSNAYSGSGFSISGMTYASAAGSYLILQKSDGSAMIPVWREPTYDNGSGAATSAIPSANTVTVNFGEQVTFNIWDPTGGTGGNNLTVTSSPTKIAGPITASSHSMTLYASPQFIEVVSATPTESTSGTFVTTVGPTVVDASLNVYAIDSNAKITTNGTEESAASNVIELYYYNHTLYYMNSNFQWYSRTGKTAAWVAAVAPFTESAQGTAVTTVGPTITDVYDNVYSISAGAYVVTNGVAETSISSGVVELYYSNRQLYQFNGSNWYTRTSPNAAYAQTASPIVTVTVAPAAVTNLAASNATYDGCTLVWTPSQYATSQIINYKLHTATTYTPLVTFSNGTTNTYTFNTLSSVNTAYDFQIIEVNSIGNSAVSNTATVTTLSGPVTHFLSVGGKIITVGGLGVNLGSY